MATIASNGTGGGDINVGASWAGGIAPVEGDKINIVSGDTITVNGTFIRGDDTTTAINVKSGGKLKFSRSASSELTVKGSLIVESGGELDMGKSGGDHIPTGILAKLRLNYSAAIANDKYTLTIASGGKFYAYGDTITRTTLLNGAITAGATTAVLDDVTGWLVGDEIVFSCTDTSANYTRYDKRTILTINTGTKTVTFAATTYAHADNSEVGNFGGNLIIESHTKGASSQGYINWAISNATGNHEVQYTSFGYLGNNNYAINFSGGNSTTNPLLIWKHNAVFEARATAGAIILQAALPLVNFEDTIFYVDDATNNSGADLLLYGGAVKNTFTDCVFYGRNNGQQVTSAGSQGGVGMIFNNCKFISSANSVILSPGFSYEFNSCDWWCQSTYCVAGAYSDTIRVNNSNFGANGVGTRNVNYVSYMATNTIGQVILTDCEFNVNTAVINGSQATALPNNKVIIANKDVDPSVQEIYTPGGNLVRDNSTFKDGSSSLRFDRIASSTIATSVSFYIFAPDGAPIAVSGFLRKNSSYGSSTRPYVTLTGLGITTSTYTMTDVNDTWEQFIVSGTQNSGTNGMLTLTVYFQSSNASASAWIDGVSAPTPAAVNSGDFGYWAAGQPVDVIAANFTAPVDVWNVLKTDAVLANSMGEQVNKIKNDTSIIPALL